MTHGPSKPSPQISDYALIGDSRCAALISHTGSIDWFCLPRFDSPSIFNCLLDFLRGGYFAVRPAGAYSTRRRYIHDTNLLITEFHTRSGIVRMTDFMPALTEEAGWAGYLGDHSARRSFQEGVHPALGSFTQHSGDRRSMRPLLSFRWSVLSI